MIIFRGDPTTPHPRDPHLRYGGLWPLNFPGLKPDDRNFIPRLLSRTRRINLLLFNRSVAQLYLGVLIPCVVGTIFDSLLLF